MRLQPEQFTKLKYNVYSLPQDQKVIEKWPELANWAEFNPKPKFEVPKKEGEEVKKIPVFGGLDHDKVLRYILLLYDKNTPLLEIDNLAQRKSETARIAGFKPRNGNTFPHKVLRMFKGGYKDINAAILYFCRTQNSSKWGLYVTLTIKHHADQEKIVNGDPDAPSSKELIADATALDDLRLTFSNRDDEESITDAVEEYTMHELGLRPEEIGRKIDEGEAVVSIRPYK